MTDNPPTPSALPARIRPHRAAVSGRLRDALVDMSWNGTPWNEAARKANLTVRAMRLALKRPQVLAFLKSERVVLLASISGATVSRLQQLRDQDENRAAAVSAAKTLNEMSEAAEVNPARMNQARAPGLVFVIQMPTGPTITVDPKDSAPMIDVTPEAEGPSAKAR